MISVLLPTRGRPDQLRASMGSLTGNASWIIGVEILVRLDDDDDVTKEIGVSCHVIRGPRHGYRNLHLYYNELAERAYGDWLLIWNDDAVMNTRGWDERIREAPNGLRVLDTGGFLFPVMSKKLYKVLGHVSLNAHNDSWLEAVSKGAGICSPVALDIKHTRISDKTAAEVDEARRESSPEFFAPACQELIRQDIEKIKQAA